MGRLLDLIFPDKAYRREREESEREKKEKEQQERLSLIERLIRRLDQVSCTSFAGLAKRMKEISEGQAKIEMHLEKIEGRLESIEKLLAIRVAEESVEGKVTSKQVLAEYLYGEHGDE